MSALFNNDVHKWFLLKKNVSVYYVCSYLRSKMSWNLVKSWSWNFTLSCWDPCNFFVNWMTYLAVALRNQTCQLCKLAWNAKFLRHKGHVCGHSWFAGAAIHSNLAARSELSLFPDTTLATAVPMGVSLWRYKSYSLCWLLLCSVIISLQLYISGCFWCGHLVSLPHS